MALFHLFRRQSPPGAALLWQIQERTLVRLQTPEPLKNLAADVRHETISDFGDEVELVAPVATDALQLEFLCKRGLDEVKGGMTTHRLRRLMRGFFFALRFAKFATRPFRDSFIPISNNIEFFLLQFFEIQQRVLRPFGCPDQFV